MTETSVKALNTRQSIVPKEFEEIRGIENELNRILQLFLKEKKIQVTNLLNQYHRGRVEAKSFTSGNILEDLILIFSVKHLEKKIRELIGNIVDFAIEGVEEETNRNITYDQSFKEVVTEQSFSKVKDLSDDLKDTLQKEFMEGWQNGEGVSQLKERVKKVWDNGNLTDARAEAIAITESNHVFNASRLKAAKESGVRLKKKWNAFFDARTGEDSKKLDGQIRELDEDFYDIVNDKYILHPPNRTRCRCRMDLIPVSSLHS